MHVVHSGEVSLFVIWQLFWWVELYFNFLPVMKNSVREK